MFTKKYTFSVTKENETQIEIPFEFLSKEEMASDYDMTEPLGSIEHAISYVPFLTCHVNLLYEGRHREHREDGRGQPEGEDQDLCN